MNLFKREGDAFKASGGMARWLRKLLLKDFEFPCTADGG